MTERAAAACQRRECTGRYEDAGGERYCDVCGRAPVVSPVGLLASPPTGVTERTVAAPGTPVAPAGPAPAATRLAAGPAPSAAGRGPARALPAVPAPGTGGGTGSGSARGRLGAGLVTVPEVPRPDPRAAVLDDPEVPERKRFCSRSDCGAPVGRTRGGVRGTTEGFCTACGHPYSFVPKLRAGDVVRGQYEVAGCLAHGGLGWIYLAVDRAVSDRWVVLKGLLDTGDEEALAVALSERRFLAEIEHANIVRIYNFVEHLDPATGSRDGYLVMEYVGGTSLKDLANARRTPQGRRDPLPVEVACAYGIEALEALGHLHSRQLLYCDFKVDNAIQQGDQLKLIDMGAVRRMDDEESAIYGTVGYQAPEVAALGPSVASDLYTVARTLAVLTFDFQGYTNVFADSLPDPEHIEVFRAYESFYRLLVRATDPDRDRRFSSAEEMAAQLTGVLREVVALRSGTPRPALSQLFGPELRVADTALPATADGGGSLLGARGRVRPRARGRTAVETVGTDRPGADEGPGLRPVDVPAAVLALPVPHVAPADPNAGFLAGLVAADPAELAAALPSAPADSLELRLRALRARLEAGDGAAALKALAALTEEDGAERWAGDWRPVWHRGLVTLATGDLESAAAAFDAVYDAFPGEPAPKLALALCAAQLGQWDTADEYYRLVWTTDRSFVSAAFGLARVRLAAGDREGAVTALESVPETSIHYTAARIAAVRARLWRRSAHEARPAELRAAAEQVEHLADFGLDDRRREQLTTEVLGSALDWVLSVSHGARPDGGHSPPERPVLLGSTLDERGLRFGLERSYRLLARMAQRGEERIELVERANRFRPRTWV
ncbi:serine/threonine-protein kinase [Streptomyces pinistramenti]|uniref:serine/threonine-protein kinase n=1 Tax=Streptomyces pinistramenti TaxID=2884812 RepID=UPI001D08D44D|nr:serine/threonine-protein kinase [Streptomyces pinistramenti]MCB5906677.1 serine/threonine-protein kinase PknG [Streptomyces pinistramenti]